MHVSHMGACPVGDCDDPGNQMCKEAGKGGIDLSAIIEVGAHCIFALLRGGMGRGLREEMADQGGGGKEEEEAVRGGRST